MEYFGRASVCEEQAEQKRREYEYQGEERGRRGLKRTPTRRVAIDEDAREDYAGDRRDERRDSRPSGEDAARA